MNKTIKRILSVVLAAVMVLGVVAVMPGKKAEAASKKDVYFYDGATKVLSYKTGDDNELENRSLLTIIGCYSGKDIKKLKSSNKEIKVSVASNGYINIDSYPDKACTSKVTCTVKGVKLSITVKIVKYACPFKSIKVGSVNALSTFKKGVDAWDAKYIMKNKKLDIKMNKNWVIEDITKVDSKLKVTRLSGLNANLTSFSKKVTIKNDDMVFIDVLNKKTKVKETICIWGLKK